MPAHALPPTHTIPFVCVKIQKRIVSLNRSPGHCVIAWSRTGIFSASYSVSTCGRRGSQKEEQALLTQQVHHNVALVKSTLRTHPAICLYLTASKNPHPPNGPAKSPAAL